MKSEGKCLRLLELPHFVDEEDILDTVDLHNDRITEIKLIKDKDDPSRCSGYGYIHFASNYDAEKALLKYQGKRIRNLNARLVLSFAPVSEGSPVDSFQLYVSNISPNTTDNDLFQFFHAHSPHVVNARLIKDPTGVSRRFGFIQYDIDEFAYKALTRFQHSPSPPTLHSSPLLIHETHQRTRAEIERGVDHLTNTVIFIGNLNLIISETQLRGSFLKFGFVESVRVVPNKGFGFVQFTDHVSALAALSEMQGTELFHQRVHVSWGRMKHDQKPTDVEHEIIRRNESSSVEYYTAMTPVVKKPKLEDKILDRRKLLEESLKAVGGSSKSVPELKFVKDINKEYIKNKMLDLITR